jgi:hypothetical protein
MLPYPPRRIPPLGPPKSSARQRVVALWRGIDLVPLEKTKAKRVKPLSAIMPGVLAGLRMEKRQSEAEVVKVWNELLEPDIVAHAQPTGIRKGTLFVTVDSNVWLSEIVRYRRHEVLARLQHSFGREFIQKISFRVG